MTRFPIALPDAEATTPGTELKLLSVTADQDISEPSGKLVYHPADDSSRVRLMGHYTQMEGWTVSGIIPDGYGPIIREGERFWVTTYGPSNRRYSTSHLMPLAPEC